MEAVPKLPFICFDLKVSPENTQFGPKLKQYIAEVYSEDPESYGNEVHQLEGLRSAAVRPTADSAGLQALNRYFCQLRAMQSRFPMGKGQPAACTFVWKDLYANMNCSLADLRFEMACILYNIGALHTRLAASEQRASADSLKLACQHLQHAAWVFQYLRDQFPQPSGADVSPEILKLLQEICYAQAQECILDKSRQDTRKPSVIGAVATQVLHLYKSSMALLGPSAGTDNIHEMIGTKLYNSWYRQLSFKVSYIGCIVALYQGTNAEEQQKMGERVAFYQLALDKWNEAQKLAKYIEPVAETQEALSMTHDIVEGKRKAAKNENEFIYHEEVPSKDMLTELKPVCLVKAVPVDWSDPRVADLDVFARLVPLGAHEAASLYSEEKAKLLRRVGTQVEAKDLEITEFLSSLQLDQLDALDQDEKIPQEVVDRCAAMSANGDMVGTLTESMNSLAALVSDVEAALAEGRALIEQDAAAERADQRATGARPPTLLHTELARELRKYSEAHARSADSNAVLHKAMALHVANLRLLARPLADLQRSVPSVVSTPGLDRAAMAEMQRVLAKAHAMRDQRAALLARLRDELAADDVTALLLADPQRPADDLFRREIEKHNSTVKILEQNLAAQENIINRLTAVYASYADSRRLLADTLRRRDAMLNGLVTSYDSFGELVSKSAKGLEFYRKLQHNLTALLARARSVCQVQAEEREQRRSAAPPALPDPSAATSAAHGAAPKLKDYLPYMKSRAPSRSTPAQGPELAPDASPDFSRPPTSARPAPLGSEGGEAPGEGGCRQWEQNVAAYSATELSASLSQMQVSAPRADQTPYGGEYAQTYFSVHYPPSCSNVATYSRAPQLFESGTATSQYGTLSSQPGTQVSQFGITTQYGNEITSYGAMSTQNGSAPSQFGATSQKETAPFSYGVEPQYGTGCLQHGSESSQYGPSFAQFGLESSIYGGPSTNGTTPSALAGVSSQYGTVPSQFGITSAQYATPSIPYGAEASQVGASLQYGTYLGTADGSQAPSYASPPDPLSYANYLNSSSYFSPGGSDQVLNVSMSSQPSSGVGTFEPGLAHLDAMDKPIKSHAKGEALSGWGGFGSNAPAFQNQQNHPGYVFNAATGNYDYSYGSQNSCLDSAQQPAAWPGVYTSAGAASFRTVQSPPEPPPAYDTCAALAPTDQSAAAEPASPAAAEAQSGVDALQPSPPAPPSVDPPAIDLLADIDFSIQQEPLIPQIKVPQISEKAVAPGGPRRPSSTPLGECATAAPRPEPERPPRRDIFADPNLVNQFTQEVKSLQKVTEALSASAALDELWRQLQSEESDAARRTLSGVPGDCFHQRLSPWGEPVLLWPNAAPARFFWEAMLEHRVHSLICLLPEVEEGGRAGDVVVSAERAGQLRLTSGVRQHLLAYFRLEALSPKAVVQACDRVLRQKGEGGVCVRGPADGRALAAVVLTLMSELRAGNVCLAETLRAASGALVRRGGMGRAGLLDAYRAALFLAQGVLGAGSSTFNGAFSEMAPAPSNSARARSSRESFEQMRQPTGLTSGDMRDPLNFLDPLWTLKKK